MKRVALRALVRFVKSLKVKILDSVEVLAQSGMRRVFFSFLMCI